MGPADGVRAALGAAVTAGGPGLSAADRLCRACVELLEVDGAAVSLMHHGVSRGTYGSSGELSRRLDELQFTLGEGPCVDAARDVRPVLVPDLRDPAEQRWPAFGAATLDLGVRAVYALPVALAETCVGVLDLFCERVGPLPSRQLAGGLLAAELAALPLLDLMTGDTDWTRVAEGDPWAELASLERVEVYQATGMIMGQLDVGPAEALVRLRAHAFAHDWTASEAAWRILDRTESLAPDPGAGTDDGGTG